VVGSQGALMRPEFIRGSMQTEHTGELEHRQREKAVWRGHETVRESASLKSESHRRKPKRPNTWKQC